MRTGDSKAYIYIYMCIYVYVYVLCGVTLPECCSRSDYWIPVKTQQLSLAVHSWQPRNGNTCQNVCRNVDMAEFCCIHLQAESVCQNVVLLRICGFSMIVRFSFDNALWSVNVRHHAVQVSKQ